MTSWIISANGRRYDHVGSFEKNGFIDWRQIANYQEGDIVYIYCTKPIKKVMFKCRVERSSMSFSDCVDDSSFWINDEEYERGMDKTFARLRLLEQTDSDYLYLDALKENGLKAAPQGVMKVSEELQEYMENHFNDYYSEGFFNDVDETKNIHEGHIIQVKVNRYERSSVARKKCIEYHGTKCLICGIDFGEKYGPLGEGFIHVHHLRPLNTIGKDYVVDYKNDLIPVCPNCHAMIHRVPNGENMKVEELKNLLNKKF